MDDLTAPVPSQYVVEVVDDDLSGRVELFADSATVRVHLSVHNRPVDPARRRHLVDALFALPELVDAEAVQVSLPLGDNDILWEVSRYLEETSTRAAGSTCLVDGSLRGDVD